MPISKLVTLTFALVSALLAASASRAAETTRSPEQVTMGRMRAIAGALLSRQIDETSGENRLGGPSTGWAGWVRTGQASTLVRMPAEKELRSPSEVVALLRPREDFIYLCDVPERDAWGERIEVYYEEEKVLTGRVVTVRSSGANRRIDSDVYEVGGFLPGGATDDIVISDKRFVRWPLGVAETELQVEPKIGRCPGFDEDSGEDADGGAGAAPAQ